MIHWFITAPHIVIFAAGVILGIPLWLLIFAVLDRAYESPYAHAQRQYEKARDAYQRKLAQRTGDQQR